MHRESAGRRSARAPLRSLRRTVGAAVVTLGVRAAVGGTLPRAGRTVGAAVVAAGVRAAVGGALAGSGRSVGAAVVALRVRAAIGDALAARAPGSTVMSSSPMDMPSPFSIAAARRRDTSPASVTSGLPYGDGLQSIGA